MFHWNFFACVLLLFNGYGLADVQCPSPPPGLYTSLAGGSCFAKELSQTDEIGCQLYEIGCSIAKEGGGTECVTPAFYLGNHCWPEKLAEANNECGETYKLRCDRACDPPPVAEGECWVMVWGKTPNGCPNYRIQCVGQPLPPPQQKH